MTQLSDRLLTFCESQRDWLIETIEAFVRLESPSTEKSAVDRCGQELERRLAAIGGRIQRFPREQTGDHLRAEFLSGDRQILILGHFDTVWPVGQLERMPVRIDGDTLSGPGTFDMKAGIAIGMLAIRALSEMDIQRSHRVVMLLTSDEEIGSRSSRSIIEAEARKSDVVLVLEPALPDGAVKTSRKGCGEFELRVRGVSAHAGIDPGKGASAIHELSRQIAALEKLQNLDRGISVNVGVIGGGTRTNVIAEEAWARVDVRVPTMADADRVATAVRSIAPQIPGTSIEISGGIERPPLERSPAVVNLFELARVIAGELGQTLDEGGTGGGSDGNFTAALGVPTLDGLGAIGDGAHALHEHVRVDALGWRAALVAGLIARLGTHRMKL